MVTLNNILGNIDKMNAFELDLNGGVVRTDEDEDNNDFFVKPQSIISDAVTINCKTCIITFYGASAIFLNSLFQSKELVTSFTLPEFNQVGGFLIY